MMVRIDLSKYGFEEKFRPIFKAKRGISKEIVELISNIKKEPTWMLDIRLEAFDIFEQLSMPRFGPKLDFDFNKITYYVKPIEKKVSKWSDLPVEIMKIYKKLGIPKAERDFLAGIGAQYESEMIYNKIKKDIEKKGVIFCDMDTAIKKHANIVKKYFANIVNIDDNKFAALNTAFWSGGSFVYVPKNVKLNLPLQTYFRIGEQGIGQFERTLIIAEENTNVHYIEGCSAPLYTESSLHAAVVEVIAKNNANVKYTTIQNWAKNIYNLVTKRAVALENSKISWTDGNMGSKVTMKYPTIILKGENAKADILSISFASNGQEQDSGAKAIHLAKNTSSIIISKSISKGNGKCVFRGTIRINENAENANAYMRCDSLLLNNNSISISIPSLDVKNKNVRVGHEATIGKIGDEQLFYMMSRGINKERAMAIIVSGFFREFIEKLPLEYAIEFNRLVQMEVEEATC